MELVIERSKWLRGEGSDQSYLQRRADGKMCCLGFYALVCGVDHIKGETSPKDLLLFDGSLPSEDMEFLLDGSDNSDIADTLMTINDAELDQTTPLRISAGTIERPKTEQEREERIAAIFAEHDVQVKFID